MAYTAPEFTTGGTVSASQLNTLAGTVQSLDSAASGGGGTAGPWTPYTLIAGLTVEDPNDQPAWRDMGDGTVQVYTGRVLNGTGGQLAAFASYVEAPAGFPTLTRQSDTWNNLQVRVTGVLVTKSAVNVDAQLPPSGQGNVYVFRVGA